MAKLPVITIEREYGSGGRVLGKVLSEQLKIPFYDDDIIIKASEKSMVGEQYFRMNDEKPGKSSWLFSGVRRAMDKPDVEGTRITSPDNLFRFEADVIRSLAEEGPCILIGRCADFVLDSADFKDYISLFVYCGLQDKIRRVIKVDGVDTEEAINRIQRINRQRKSYYRYYTGNHWGDPALYDLPLNTSNITIPQSAELVKLYLKLRGYEVDA